MGDQQRKVGVGRTKRRIVVGVPVRRHYAAVILDHHMARRVAAEGADPGAHRRIENEFAFIEMLVDLLHDNIRGLNADTDIHLVVVHLQAAALEDLGQPG
ncbi:hypothetical protein D3C71_1697160 [compost metagenome]